MATKVIDILDQAWEKSVKNRSSLAEDDPELLGVLNRAIAGYFYDAARMTSTVWSKRAGSGAAVGTGQWAKPADAIRIYDVRRAGGDRVYVMPLFKRDQDIGAPAIYPVDGFFFSIAGNPAQTDQLVYHYARKAYRSTGVEDNIDTAYPDDLTELLATRVGLHLAKKSSERGNEVGELKEEQKEWEGRLYAHLASQVLFDVGTHGRHAPANLEPMPAT